MGTHTKGASNANAPEVAWRFAMVILWHVQQLLAERKLRERLHVSVVCDDWLIIALTEAACRAAWQLIIEVLQELGFTVNMEPHKLIAPCHSLVRLGLQLDSTNMTVALPAAKVQKKNKRSSGRISCATARRSRVSSWTQRSASSGGHQMWCLACAHSCTPSGGCGRPRTVMRAQRATACTSI